MSANKSFTSTLMVELTTMKYDAMLGALRIRVNSLSSCSLYSSHFHLNLANSKFYLLKELANICVREVVRFGEERFHTALFVS